MKQISSLDQFNAIGKPATQAGTQIPIFQTKTTVSDDTGDNIIMAFWDAFNLFVCLFDLVGGNIKFDVERNMDFSIREVIQLSKLRVFKEQENYNFKVEY